MTKALISHDPLTGVSSFFHYDAAEDEIVIENTQQTDPLLDANRAAFNDADKRYGKEEFTKVASIPLVLYQELRRKGIAQDPKALKRWLNDPDNRFFRTKPGVV